MTNASQRFVSVLDSIDAAYAAAEALAENGGSVRPLLAIGTARDDIISKTEVIRDGVATAAGYVDLATGRLNGSLPGSVQSALDGAFRTIRYTDTVLARLSLTATGWGREFRGQDPRLDDMLFQLAWNVEKLEGTLDNIRVDVERLDFVRSRGDVVGQ